MVYEIYARGAVIEECVPHSAHAVLEPLTEQSLESYTNVQRGIDGFAEGNGVLDPLGIAGRPILAKGFTIQQAEGAVHGLLELRNCLVIHVETEALLLIEYEAVDGFTSGCISI